MNTVYVLHHSHELEGQEDSKLIGVYSSREEAEFAINRSKSKPGFKYRPDGFIINEYELNHDEWPEGFSTMTIIHVKDVKGNWKSVTARVSDDNKYEIVEKYEN